jgi:hypothetical protein
MLSDSYRSLRVFLCHASEDKPAVRELYKRLASEKWIEPWLDEESLLPGQTFDLEIHNATRDADAIIICLSTLSVAKEGYVNREIRRVLDISQEKTEGAIFVVPLRLDDCKPSFEQLRKLHWLDYFPADRLEQAYIRLCRSLELRAKTLGIIVEKAQSKVELEHPIASEPVLTSTQRSMYLKAILKISEEILGTANSTLIENQRALAPLFQEEPQVKTSHDNIMMLYLNQQSRGDFGEWTSYLEETKSKVTDPELRNIIESLLSEVESLYNACYSERPFSDLEETSPPEKFSMITALGSRRHEFDNLGKIVFAKMYLDYMRKIVENIGRLVGKLRQKVELG